MVCMPPVSAAMDSVTKNRRAGRLAGLKRALNPGVLHQHLVVGLHLFGVRHERRDLVDPTKPVEKGVVRLLFHARAHLGEACRSEHGGQEE